MTSVLDAIALIDAVLGAPSPERIEQERENRNTNNLLALGLTPAFMGGIATKGCPRCGGTMIRTEEPDGEKQWVCRNLACGAVE